MQVSTIGPVVLTLQENKGYNNRNTVTEPIPSIQTKKKKKTLGVTDIATKIFVARMPMKRFDQ